MSFFAEGTVGQVIKFGLIKQIFRADYDSFNRIRNKKKKVSFWVF